jgi:hypothetical protein
MANNIVKPYYAGGPTDPLAPAEQDNTPIVVHVEDPEAIEVGPAGGPMVRIEFGEMDDDEFYENLAEHLEPEELSEIGMDLLEDINNDSTSRDEWEKTYKEGVNLLGLTYEERAEPWDGACGVYHPMITEAIVRFQAETITETFPAAGPVKTKILGEVTPEKEESAERVRDDLNHILVDEMPEFRPEHEKMLWNVAMVGSAFKKVYMDPSLGRQTSVFVPAEDILLPYGSSGELSTTERVTQIMRKSKNEIKRLIYDGFYKDFDVSDAYAQRIDDIAKAKDRETGMKPVNDDRHLLFEALVYLELPGFEDKDEDGRKTGLALPYVVTVTEQGDVLSIRRNWRKDDKAKQPRQHFVHYQYIPGFGPYGFGLIHLIGGYAKAATSISRQLIDAGTLSNLPGGLKTNGLRIKGDDTPIAPGEFRDVDVGGGTIRDNIMPLPYKEPSQTLYNLLGNLIEEGRAFASSSDAVISDLSNQGPVGSTLAILERSLKTMSAVQARIHYSFKQEIKLIAEIVKENASDDYGYDAEFNGRKAKKQDYQHTDIIPVSDPNASTMAQRIVQYQAVMQMAQTAPQIYDLPFLHREMLTVLGVKNIDKLIPDTENAKPTDPVTENLNALEGKPLQAFVFQDHESHIKVHQMAMQDPLIQQLIGQNPQAPAIQAALQAHLAQHVGFAYRAKMQLAMGMPIPQPDQQIPAQAEIHLSQVMAQAAPQVLQQSKQLVAQQQAVQNQQDPVIQQQLQDQQLQMAELQRKQKKDEQDFIIAQKRLALDEKRVDSEMHAKGIQLGLDAADKKAQLASKERTAGAKIGADIAKHKAQMGDKAVDRKHKQRVTRDAQAHDAAMQIMQQQQTPPDNEGGAE